MNINAGSEGKKVADQNSRFGSAGDELQPQGGKEAWHRNPWIRAIAIILVIAMIVTAVTPNLNIEPVQYVDDQPTQALLDSDMQEAFSHPIELLDATREALYDQKKQEKKIRDAAKKAQDFIGQKKYALAVEPVTYLVEHAQLDQKQIASLRQTRAALCLASGDYAGAADDCSWLIREKYDEDGSVFFLRSVCEIRQAQYKESRDDLLSALEAGYSSPAVCYLHLAFCENYLEDYEKVLEYAQKTQQIGAPQGYEATLIYLEAVACLKLQRYSDAVVWLDQLLVYDDYKENGSLYYYRGLGELTQKKYQKAYDDFNKAMEYGFDGGSGTGMQGETESESGISGTGRTAVQPQSQESQTDQAAGQPQDQAESLTTLYYNRAAALLGLERYEEAMEDFRRVIDRGDNPQLTEASQKVLKLFEEAAQAQTEGASEAVSAMETPAV